MAKDREKRIARILYVEQGKTAKETCEIIGVAEKTMGDWVERFNWKQERNARNTSSHEKVINIKAIIALLSEQRLELNNKLKQTEKKQNDATDDTKQEDCRTEEKEIRKQINQVDAAVANWNKTLGNLEKEYRISLSVYLEVMDDIFNALLHFSPQVHQQTLDFQELHIRTITMKLG
jgi:transposase